MNITNQTYVPNAMAFKAVQPEIMQNLGKYTRAFRENLGKSYNVLQNSEILDLALNKNGEVVLKTKKDLHNVIKTSKPVLKDTELYQETVCKGDKDSILHCTCHSISDGFESSLNLNLDFGSSENAQKALSAYGEKTCLYSFLPLFGALLDTAYRLSKPVKEMEKIMFEALER